MCRLAFRFQELEDGWLSSGINGSGATLLTNNWRFSVFSFEPYARPTDGRLLFRQTVPGRNVRDTTMSNIWVMNADRSDVTSHHQTHRWGGARPLTLMTADDLCGGPYKRPAQRESNGIPDLRKQRISLAS